MPPGPQTENREEKKLFAAARAQRQRRRRRQQQQQQERRAIGQGADGGRAGVRADPVSVGPCAWYGGTYATQLHAYYE